MIRINLLPVKAAKRREAGQRQVLLGTVVLLAAVAGVVTFHGWASAQLNTQKGQINSLKTDIAALKHDVGDYDEIKQQRDDLKRQKDAIDRLEKGRSGPVYLMRELSDILTRGKGPTFNKMQYEETLRRDPNAGINQSWEPKRAWLISYAEKAGAVTIHAGAKSDEDVAEFLKRLKLSAFFSDVYWQQTQPQVDPKNKNVAYVTFDVACRVNY
jgi:type IV pilus assembly protein PilN